MTAIMPYSYRILVVHIATLKILLPLMASTTTRIQEQVLLNYNNVFLLTICYKRESSRIKDELRLLTFSFPFVYTIVSYG